MHAEEIIRFKQAVNEVVENVDKAYIRDLQADSHTCAANCCRDKESSTEYLLHCVEKCSLRLKEAQRIVLEQFDRLEDKFERCISSCGDYVKDSRNGKPDPAQDSLLLGGCIRRCVDSNIDIIPDLIKTINEAMNRSQMTKRSIDK